MLSPAARILAAADVYQAMTEPRPHRPALAPESAAEQLRREVRAGRLDSEATHSVLAAAGHRVRKTRHELVAGLSEREVEVLRLIARGHSKKQNRHLWIVVPLAPPRSVTASYQGISLAAVLAIPALFPPPISESTRHGPGGHALSPYAPAGTLCRIPGWSPASPGAALPIHW